VSVVAGSQKTCRPGKETSFPSQVDWHSLEPQCGPVHDSFVSLHRVELRSAPIPALNSISAKISSAMSTDPPARPGKPGKQEPEPGEVQVCDRPGSRSIPLFIDFSLCIRTYSMSFSLGYESYVFAAPLFISSDRSLLALSLSLP
jgi:hypothetical protein